MNYLKETKLSWEIIRFKLVPPSIHTPLFKTIFKKASHFIMPILFLFGFNSKILAQTEVVNTSTVSSSSYTISGGPKQVSFAITGANGGNGTTTGGGKGAIINATYNLNNGDVINYLVAEGGFGGSEAGGAGSTGIYINGTLVLVAGGGAGGDNSAGAVGLGANSTTNGDNGVGIGGGAGGTNGAGGGATVGAGAGGGGINSAGANTASVLGSGGGTATANYSLAAGGTSAIGSGSGGRGLTGGGAGGVNYAGGAGGYSGGGASGNGGSAGGGGSYVNTTLTTYLTSIITAGADGATNGGNQANGTDGSVKITVTDLTDTDNDGIADVNDEDSDNDGILDADEGCSAITGTTFNLVPAESVIGNIAAGGKLVYKDAAGNKVVLEAAGTVGTNNGFTIADGGADPNDGTTIKNITTGEIIFEVIANDANDQPKLKVSAFSANGTAFNIESIGLGGIGNMDNSTAQDAIAASVPGFWSNLVASGNALSSAQITTSPVGATAVSNITQAELAIYNFNNFVSQGAVSEVIFNHSDDLVQDGYNATFTPKTPVNSFFIIVDDITTSDADGRQILTHLLTTSITISGTICRDTDSDGIPDNLDLDSDNDGCSDAIEAGTTTNQSTNYQFPSNDVSATGVPNTAATPNTSGNYINAAVTSCDCPFASGIDTDGDGLDDTCDQDNDNDGILDTDECMGIVYSVPLVTEGFEAASFVTDAGVDDAACLFSPSFNIPKGGGINLLDPSTITGWQPTTGVVEATKGLHPVPSGKAAVFNAFAADASDATNICRGLDVDHNGNGRFGEIVSINNVTVVAGVSYSVAVYAAEVSNTDPFVNSYSFKFYNAGTTTLAGIPDFSLNNITQGNQNWQLNETDFVASVTKNIDIVLVQTNPEEFGADIALDAFSILRGTCSGDTDKDGVLNIYDLDSDNDGIPDVIEAGGTDANNDGRADDDDNNADNTGSNGIPTSAGTGLTPTSTDGDSIPDYLDLDSDNDGIPDVTEAGGTDANNDGRADDDDNNADNTGSNGIPTSAGTGLTPTSTDGDSVPDYLDLDADNDGIPDNIEGQTTIGYVAPSGADTDNDGLDDAYDQDCTGANCSGVSGAIINPVNADNTDTADYIDLDADNDGIFDVIESGSGLANDGNGVVTGAVGTNGLVDAIETGDSDQGYTDVNGEYDNTQADNFTDTDNDVNTGGDVDYRDAQDNDNDKDGVPDSVDLDDDNDGILDTEECTVPSANISQISSSFVDSGAPGDVGDIAVYSNITTYNGESIDLRVTVLSNSNPANMTVNIAGVGSSPNIYPIFLGGNQFSFDGDSASLKFEYLISGTNTLIPVIASFVWKDIDLVTGFSSGNGTESITFNTNEIAAYTVDTPTNIIVNSVGGETVFTSSLNSNTSNTKIMVKTEMLKTSSFTASFRKRDGPTNDTGYLFGSTTFANPVKTQLIGQCEDTDGDSIPDYLDLDSDNDGIPDVTEAGGTDANNDGRADDDDNNADNTGSNGIPTSAGTGLTPTSTDGDSIPDYLDLDADNDGIPDVTEAGGIDLNNDGRADDDDNNADNTGSNGIPTSAGTGLTPTSTDGDSVPDYLDLDADNDGIPDNIEGQTTTGYVAPSGADTDNDGLDDAYDQDCTGTNCSGVSGAIINPVNADNADTADYIDLDADNDGVFDVIESGSGLANDGNGVVTGAVGTNGLVDAIETGDSDQGYTDINGEYDNTQADNFTDTDNDVNTGGDVDYRDAQDNDNDKDGVPDSVDLDDDNDGILDTDEGFSCPSTSYIDLGQAFTNTSTNTNGGNASGNVANIYSFGGTSATFSYELINAAQWVAGVSSKGPTVGVDGNYINTQPNFTNFPSGSFYPANAATISAAVYKITFTQPVFNVEFKWGGSDHSDRTDFLANLNGSNTPLTISNSTLASGSYKITGQSLVSNAIGANAPSNAVLISSQGPLNEIIIVVGKENGDNSNATTQLFELKYCAALDTDNDGIPNHLDLDSDNDGIPDVTEAGGTDSNNDGRADDNDNNADNTGSNGIPTSANTGLMPTSSDADGILDYLDLDADNDGIPDNIEAQTTLGYVAPTGVDTDKDGLDDAYDPDCTGANCSGVTGTLIVPVNTDGADTADYIDLDADNDGIFDIIESGSGLANDGSGVVTGAVGTNGLVDAIETGDTDLGYTDVNGEYDNTQADNFTDTDGDVSTGGDVDYRDVQDNDNDGIPDSVDLDDDNDGIPDTAENGVNFADGDEDGDGIPNYKDTADTAGGTGDGSTTDYTDSNNDGIPDVYDADGDGIPNHFDLDTDNDGIPDLIEAGGVDTNGDGVIDYPTLGDPTTMVDLDGDGLADTYDDTDTAGSSTGWSAGTPISNPDSDGDGIPDAQDLDADNDGIPDVVEAGGTDANGDGRADNFVDIDNDGFNDLVDGDINGTTDPTKALIITGTDGNSDGIPDNYSNGDTDGDGLLDSTDLDADNDGIPDLVEAGGIDTNGDGRVDTNTDADKDGLADIYDENATDGPGPDGTNGIALVETDAAGNMLDGAGILLIVIPMELQII